MPNPRWRDERPAAWRVALYPDLPSGPSLEIFPSNQHIPDIGSYNPHQGRPAAFEGNLEMPSARNRISTSSTTRGAVLSLTPPSTLYQVAASSACSEEDMTVSLDLCGIMSLRLPATTRRMSRVLRLMPMGCRRSQGLTSPSPLAPGRRQLCRIRSRSSGGPGPCCPEARVPARCRSARRLSPALPASAGPARGPERDFASERVVPRSAEPHMRSGASRAVPRTRSMAKRGSSRSGRPKIHPGVDGMPTPEPGWQSPPFAAVLGNIQR